MKGDLPSGLPPQVRNAAQLLIQNARQEGWEIGPIELALGTVSFSAKSPTGRGFYFCCAGDDFVGRLKSVLVDGR